MPTLSQTIAWDPSAFIGFSAEQVELIRRGFMFALDRVYEREVELDDAGEWDAAMADMKAREGAWEDNACRPVDGYECLA